MNQSDLPGISPDWPAPANVRAFMATRDLGDGEFTLGVRAEGCDPAQGEANRVLLQQQMSWPEQPQWLKQVHGIDVVIAQAGGVEREADACWSNQQGAICSVLTADCLPVLFCDRAGTTVAAAHAGWKGLADGVLESTIQTMGVAPGELMAWFGPAIGPCHFEVGLEVKTAFTERHSATEEAFTASRNAGRWMGDLYRIARIRLAAAGVNAVYGGGLCTYCDAGKFYSFRRGQESGRMGSFIWLE